MLRIPLAVAFSSQANNSSRVEPTQVKCEVAGMWNVFWIFTHQSMVRLCVEPPAP